MKTSNINYNVKGNDIVLSLPLNMYSMGDTLDCGQCFRFKQGENKNEFSGVAFGRVLTLFQDENEIILKDTSKDDFESIWREFFDFDTDYEAIKKSLMADEALNDAITFAGGIHILKQDSFEALISFIISQNNNIPRIKGSINKLCAKFGKKISEELYSFPTLDELCGVKKEDLCDLSLGYRDDYIVDCVQKLKSGEISLEAIKTLPIADARIELRKIKGVGPKVAECALLFGFYRVEAFPIDTWIKKVLATYYPNGFPKEYEHIAGIAQQYLFHAIRNNKQ